jgi:hypothetical protein
MKNELRIGKAEQERRAQQAARRAEGILSASSAQLRKAERAAREAYRVEVLPWRIEGGNLRPRRQRAAAGSGRRMAAKRTG